MRFADSGSAYSSVSELVEVAVRNQLTLEAGGSAAAVEIEDGSAPDRPRRDVLDVPPHRDLGFANPTEDPRRALSPFTNRLFPIKLACRAAANLATTEMWPDLGEFHRQASDAARALGLEIRRADEAQRRRGSDRRWIALPVGSDPAAAARRYAAHFTIDRAADGRITGPMGDLGLGNVDDEGRVQLTELGWALGRVGTPLLGEADGQTLGAEEREILFEALQQNESELARISEFAGLLESTTEQAQLDVTLAELHPDWSEAGVRSHRAAMLGRLGDLGIVRVEGRGPAATVLFPAGLPDALSGGAGA
jgi:hypothetical protein